MTRTNERVYLAARRWPHHSAHSGYELLGRYVGHTIAAHPTTAAVLPRGMVDSVARGMPGYDRAAAAVELRVLAHMAATRGALYHFVYGEDSFNRLSACVGWREHRVVASYHHPPAKLVRWVPDRRVMSALSGAIVLGRNQERCLLQHLPRERVFVVPLGVDTTFFQPAGGTAVRQRRRCLTVGSHLRDFATLRQVVRQCRFVAPDVHFDLVLPPDARGALQGVQGHYTVHGRLDDEQLRALYQSASLLVLPLDDAVANLALLEALACGLPAVVSDVGAVREYADDTCAAFVRSHDADAMCATILSLLDSPDRRAAMSAAARHRALEFDWPSVARHSARVYETLMSMSPRC